jgi:hypothetical protein
MDVRIASGDDPCVRDQLFRLRYRVYVEQQGYAPPEADHLRQMLADDLDPLSVSKALIQNAEVVGSLRMTQLCAVIDRRRIIDRLALGPAIAKFGVEALGLTSRFLFDQMRAISPKGMFRLLEAGYVYGMQVGCRILFGDCSAGLLAFYQHLGYRTYARPYIDPVFGEKFPLLMILRDPDEFTKRRSPMARCTHGCPADIEAVCWFEETYGRRRDASSEHELGPS